jgi:hypothetical protein
MDSNTLSIEVNNTKNNPNIPSFVNVCLINAQSIASLNHLSFCKFLLKSLVVDVLAVTETWLTPLDSDSFCSIPGYNGFRNDRIGKCGGGVCLYIRNNLEIKILCKSPGNFTNNPEYIITDIKCKTGKILLCVVYRRSNGNMFDNFIDGLSSHYIHYDYCIVAGDINIDFNVEMSTIKINCYRTL